MKIRLRDNTKCVASRSILLAVTGHIVGGIFPDSMRASTRSPVGGGFTPIHYLEFWGHFGRMSR